MASTTPRSGTIASGELARRTGCNIDTFRYYERIGLLPVPGRKGRFRRYGKADVQLLTFVRRARELGFTLDEVRALLRLSARNGDTCSDVRRDRRGASGRCARKDCRSTGDGGSIGGRSATM
jgi:DNA-binding transcriptional MerR regulator